MSVNINMLPGTTTDMIKPFVVLRHQFTTLLIVCIEQIPMDVNWMYIVYWFSYEEVRHTQCYTAVISPHLSFSLFLMEYNCTVVVAGKLKAGIKKDCSPPSSSPRLSMEVSVLDISDFSGLVLFPVLRSAHSCWFARHPSVDRSLSLPKQYFWYRLKHLHSWLLRS